MGRGHTPLMAPSVTSRSRPNGRVLIVSLLLCYSGYSTVRLWSAPAETFIVQTPAVTVPALTEVLVPTKGFESPPLLNGVPTAAFRDNLRPQVKYVTSWPVAGFTNDMIAYIHLIYLALLTERVPIVPFFRPYYHLTQSVDQRNGPNMEFGQVFDIPRLERGLGKRVLEWWQVKDHDSTTVDVLGCWNIAQATNHFNTGPHEDSMPDLLKLDISYTTAPTWIKLYPDSPGDPFFTFSSLASLAYPEKRNENLQMPLPSPILKASLPPDEQLLCFDDLYSGATIQAHEIGHDFSPAWRFVGQHLHWTPAIEVLAEEYLRHAFGLSPEAPVPPYIAVHVRHGDFREFCGDVPHTECFAPLPVIARRVHEVRATLLERKGLAAEHVVVTSDEQDEEWWAAVHALGWAVPDHTDTVRLHGKWFPVLIDAAIQSAAIGLVGTEGSTGGEIRMVQWGRVGADDH
ncbi:hypothetical protein DFH09DRAFT_1266420 [Mycena vulgaris]|nr:hypothetical protein DFH09DRAFT_1266420 [Mycena vulgaris]